KSDVPTIDIDRDAAHQAAQHELAKPIYPKASLTQRLLDWLDEQLYRLADAASAVPGGWFTVVVLRVLLTIAPGGAGPTARAPLGAPCAPTATASTPCSATMCSAQPSIARPLNSMQPRVIGRRRSVTGSEPSHANWRKARYSTRSPGAPRPNWLVMPDGLYRIWPSN